MSLKYYLQPWNHQLASIEECRNRDFFALFYEVGCGKTGAMINILRERYKAARHIQPTLILCPIIVVESWRREFLKHAGSAVNDSVLCLTGTAPQRRKQWENRGKKQIVVTNLDVVNTDFWDVLKQERWETLVLDESHRCKNPKAKRTEKLISFSERVPSKFILTGTPILNSSADIWSQIRILSSTLVDSNFYVWRAHFFYDKNAGMPRHIYFPDWRPRESTNEELQRLIASCSHRVTKAEVLPNLPPLLRQTTFVELSAEQQKHYNEMERQFITFIQDKACTANLALTKMLRLQQIIAGIIKTEDGEVTRIESSKQDALADLLDIAYHHKVIVWTPFIDTYDDIAAACESKKPKLKYVKIIGGQKAAERQAAVDAFQGDPEVRVCIANQGAGGTGIGLQAASVAIYYQKTYSLEHDLQSRGRNHRGGSEIHDSITHIDICAQGTVDEVIDAALEGKVELGNLLLTLRRHYGVEANG